MPSSDFADVVTLLALVGISSVWYDGLGLFFFKFQ